jgi:hypothetical protein
MTAYAGGIGVLIAKGSGAGTYLLGVHGRHKNEHKTC